MGHLGDDLFKEINVFGYVSAVHVSEGFNGVAEGLAPLLGK